MSRDNDILDDIPSMVPERDELVTHRKRKRGTSASGSGGAASSAPYVQEVQVSRTSGAVVFLLSILFIGMCAAGAGGYYFYTQSETTKAELLRATTRIGQLESRLNLVDQAAEQSSLDLVERVEFNFSEIDKLWAARNVLRQDVGELKTSMTGVQGLTKSLETTVGEHSKTLDENVSVIQARIDEINENFSGMDNLGQQLTLLNADLNRVKTSMSALEDDVISRLNDYEQDIESINVYRLQVNQTISSLQDSVNRLEQLVAPGVSP